MSDPCQEIAGARTRLRPIVQADLESLRLWRNANREMFLDNREITPEGQRAWFQAYVERDDDCLYIIESVGGIAIGCVGLSEIDREAGVAEFGRLLIGEEGFRGAGFARDAAAALVSHARDVLGLRELRLMVLHGNERAQALYSALGFREDASLDGQVLRDGCVVAWRGMSLDLGLWEHLKGEGR